MLEIIILFIIASILSNIVKALGRSASSQKNGAPREMASQTNQTFTRKKDIKKMEESNHEIKIEETVSDIVKAPQVRPQAMPQAKPRVKPQVVPQTATELNQLQIDSKRGGSIFTPNRLMEGIILSEILAPPKSRRQHIR